MMKTYVVISNVDQKFDTMQEAVQYAEDNFSEDIESFEMWVWSEDGEENLDYQTVERNPYSGNFVYSAWSFGISKWKDNNYDWYGDVFDTFEQLLENEDYIAAKEKGYGLRIDKYEQTVYENIGDPVDTYYVNVGDKEDDE